VSLCDLDTSAMKRSKTALGRSAKRKQKIRDLLKKLFVELAYWLKDLKHCKMRFNLVLQQFIQYPLLI